MLRLLDSILWKLSRAYRRRKMRQSRVHAELLQAIPHDTRLLDAYLERPAILAGRGASDRPEGARGQTYAHLTEVADFHLSPYQVEMLREKLADEAITRGREPEYWCEFCPQYGHCCICGQNHAEGT